MYQQITLVGNLGSDPEMRFTSSGVPVASFSLAVNRSWTGQDGQRQDKTTWFRISVWNKQAEIVSQYLSKGRQVLVVGEMEDARAFTDRDGNLRASLEVRANTVRFLGQRGDNMSGADMGSGFGNSSGSSSMASAGGDMQDEDIPF
ncbi:MAG: single-stranded DNA-binding protein [Caldilineaceae bacterium]